MTEISAEVRAEYLALDGKTRLEISCDALTLRSATSGKAGMRIPRRRLAGFLVLAADADAPDDSGAAKRLVLGRVETRGVGVRRILQLRIDPTSTEFRSFLSWLEALRPQASLLDLPPTEASHIIFQKYGIREAAMVLAGVVAAMVLIAAICIAMIRPA